MVNSLSETSTGRPPIIETPEQLERLGNEYFAQCEAKGKQPTTSGLAFYLGFCSRQSLWDYKQDERFSYSVKKLIIRIEDHHESRLDDAACAGSIFWLKNHQWSDRQELALSTPDGAIKIDPGRDKLTDEQIQRLLLLADTSKP